MGHEHLPYPNELPYEDILAVVKAVRQGTLTSDPATATKALWELSGYAALMSIGEPEATRTPTPAPAIHTSQAPVSDEQILTCLEDYADAQQASNPDVAQALNIPWAAVLKWAVKILVTVVAA